MADIDIDRLRRMVMSAKEAAEVATEIETLRARLAEVEAERDNLQCTADYDLRYQRDLEARLAAVLALCDRWGDARLIPAWQVRAAATGEDKEPRLGRCEECGAMGVDVNTHCGRGVEPPHGIGLDGRCADCEDTGGFGHPRAAATGEDGRG